MESITTWGNLPKLRATPEAEPRAGVAGSHLHPHREFRLWGRASEAQPQHSREPAHVRHQRQPCTPVNKPHVRNQPPRARHWGMCHIRPNAEQSAEICCGEKHSSSVGSRPVQQGRLGILHTATRASAPHCPFPVLCQAIHHPTVQRADKVCSKEKGRFKYWCSKLLC